jgi:hypothetical protein
MTHDSGRVYIRSMMAAPTDNGGMAKLKVSIVFESGARIGPGKARVLECTRETGSISAAAPISPAVFRSGTL